MHNPAQTLVVVDCCPSSLDWSLERFVERVYEHWRRGHELIPASKMPAWLIGGLELLGRLKANEAAEAEADNWQ